MPTFFFIRIEIPSPRLHIAHIYADTRTAALVVLASFHTVESSANVTVLPRRQKKKKESKKEEKKRLKEERG